MAAVARNIWLRYPGQRGWALRGASLELHPGTVVALVGPNGGGKTSLLKTLGLLLQPQRGIVEVDGVDTARASARELLEARRRIVYVHDNPPVARGTVLYNLMLGPLLRGAPREEALEAALAAARETGLPEELLDKPASSLSRGQRQLVAVARALAVNPRYILLDEPTANLDAAARRRLEELIQRLKKRGHGVAVATHDTLLAARIADEVVEVVEGETRPARLEDPCRG